MKIIHKKIDEKYLDDLINGYKSFELRRDEDNAKVGDILHLYISGKVRAGAFFQITYILKDYDGLDDGFVIYAVSQIEEKNLANYSKNLWISASKFKEFS